MIKKSWAGLALASAILLPGAAAEAADNPIVEAGEIRSTGNTAKVPVVIRNTTYLNYGQVTVQAESGKGVKPVSFEPSNLFNDAAFRTRSRIDGHSATIDFNTLNGEAQRMMDDRIVIGYITYELDGKTFTPGTAAALDVMNVTAKGRNNADITFKDLDGKLEHKMPIGDVTGRNQVGPQGAIRILQHIAGDLVTEREAFLSADVDADGLLTQEDARLILDFSTGKLDTFLALEKKDLASAVLKSEYIEQVQARHGRAPYTYKRKNGSMPSGVKIDEAGKIEGTPSRAGNYTFTIEAIDALGQTSTREFMINVIDSNITAVEPLNTINVKLGEAPVLPSQVKVTYKDKTTGMENVTWGAVDTSQLGEVTAKGTIGGTGFMVTVKVNVVSTDYLQKVEIEHVQMLNVYTLTMHASSEVYAITVNNMAAHYEGESRYSLASTSFVSGSSAAIRAYDKYGNLLETKAQRILAN